MIEKKIEIFCFNKVCSNKQIRSNINRVYDTHTSSVTKTTHRSNSDVVKYMCPPTPCMIDYRHTSLPNLIPTRTIKRPNSFDQLLQQTDFDQFNA